MSLTPYFEGKCLCCYVNYFRSRGWEKVIGWLAQYYCSSDVTMGGHSLNPITRKVDNNCPWIQKGGLHGICLRKSPWDGWNVLVPEQAPLLWHFTAHKWSSKNSWTSSYSHYVRKQQHKSKSGPLALLCIDNRESGMEITSSYTNSCSIMSWTP